MARSGDPTSYAVDGTAEVTIDAAADDSDKIITVPGDEEWDVLAVGVELVSTATAGNRQVDVHFRTAAGVIFSSHPAGAVQGASVTRNYTFAPGVPNLTGFVGTLLTTPTPRMILGPGQQIRVFDSAAVDAAADDMTVKVQYIKRPL